MADENVEENAFHDANNLDEVLGMLAGAASVCWENPDMAGVFDSEQVSRFVRHARIRLEQLGIINE